MASGFTQLALDTVPEPCLSNIYAIFKSIFHSVETAHGQREQWTTLVGAVAQLLNALNIRFKVAILKETETVERLEVLETLLLEVLEYEHEQSTAGFFKFLYRQKENILAMEMFYQRIAMTVNAFHVSERHGVNIHVNMQKWQERHTEARQVDQEELDNRMATLESNYTQLADMLREHHSNTRDLMVSIQKFLLKEASEVNARQKHFFLHTLKYLSTKIGEPVQLRDWMVSSFEIEFGEKIGSGGFGQVFRGDWNSTPVALRVFRHDAGGIPSKARITHEIETWSRLRHPHILQFLGANITNEPPFIVTPYLKNGNSRDYILTQPNADRLNILHDACLGLTYLHSQNVIHGDVKGLNILIDDAGRAVLSDFGLSRVKSDASLRASKVTTSVVGSRNWMSPERLDGGSLNKSHQHSHMSLVSTCRDLWDLVPGPTSQPEPRAPDDQEFRPEFSCWSWPDGPVPPDTPEFNLLASPPQHWRTKNFNYLFIYPLCYKSLK